ncbi:MAG: tRNA uridine-5-carboxymethylaminomethyl(34) synthesis enzyme MnmG [Tissierellia bacterium]|nr:tRNA uridine-5-carboxymethylaminomethyl(34) synthesis enzyme MnmG [Tissierellia bacterium]
MSNIKPYEGKSYEIIVVGAGHAGTEAALAAARMGHDTLLMTMQLDSIVALSCNPNIGGTGKGHLVREVDALGGEMALNIDKTYLQSRMLNTSKGPAVHSLRVQADKREYHEAMKTVLENEPNLTLRQGEVVSLLYEGDIVTGVATATGAIYRAKAVIVCTGTYLRGRIFMGELNYSSGPDNMRPAEELSSSLTDMGIGLRRMKTGTPARIHKDYINYENMELQEGDETVVPFSFLNSEKILDRPQIPCYLTYTTPKAHEIIRENIHRSALYLGDIEGVGPRYCPSIEDKIVRFPDRDNHQVFIEPEGASTKEMYVQGVSSSLPEEVQMEIYKNIEGLENVRFMRSAYAIEYDAIDATTLKNSLEHQKWNGLFFAGQINGSSGYEEAAAQGIIAGINAVLKIEGKEPLILDRSQAYIGVLIDDLVTKFTDEPYRMMTARSEYRLTLRQDNADLRLTDLGYEVGLVQKNRYDHFYHKKENVDSELKRLQNIVLTPTEATNSVLEGLNSAPIKTAVTMAELLRRSELNYLSLAPLDIERPVLKKEVWEQVEIQIKYEGYIQKQQQQIDKFRKLESQPLELEFDYDDVQGLSTEARAKLKQIKPQSVGQASRISGVSPADINVLLIYLEMRRRRKFNEMA